MQRLEPWKIHQALAFFSASLTSGFGPLSPSLGSLHHYPILSAQLFFDHRGYPWDQEWFSTTTTTTTTTATTTTMTDTTTVISECTAPDIELSLLLKKWKKFIGIGGTVAVEKLWCLAFRALFILLLKLKIHVCRFYHGVVNFGS